MAATSTVATAQVIKPCAVSRKKTSCVCVLIHRVRNRPATYPPKPEEIHCVTISQIAEVTTNVVAEMPCPGQGEIAANPSPDPSVKNTSDTAAATKAPAMMAGQDTADGDVDCDPNVLPRPTIDCSIFFPGPLLAVRAHREQENDRKGNAQQPKQNSATHDSCSL